MTDQHLLAHLSHNSGLYVSKSHASATPLSKKKVTCTYATHRKFLHALNLHLYVCPYTYSCIKFASIYMCLSLLLLLCKFLHALNLHLYICVCPYSYSYASVLTPTPICVLYF